MITSRLHPALFVAVVAAVMTRAPSAVAASVATTAGAIVTHTLPGGQSFTRDPTLNPSGINYEDCERDVTFTFPITVSGATPGSDQLFVYAGTNCADPNQRTGAVGTTCWQVYDGAYPYTPDTNLPISLQVRQILSQQFTGVTQSFVASTGESICHQQSTSAAQTLNVYFIVTDSTGTLTEAIATAVINADLAASIEPPNFALDIGDTQLLPKWARVSDSDISGYNVYYQAQGASVAAMLMTVCPDGGTPNVGADGDSDASSEAGLTDAGTPTGCTTEAVIDPIPQADGNAQPFVPTGFTCVSPFPANDEQPVGGIATTSTTTTDVDGSADAGTTTVTSTGGSIGPLAFQPQEFDPSTFQLVTASSGASGATISGLVDNHSYAVAVAATDAYGNVGALTSATGLALCQYPLATTDFWSQYQSDGGENAGCNLGDPQLPGGAGAASLLAGAACIAALRKRKKR